MRVDDTTFIDLAEMRYNKGMSPLHDDEAPTWALPADAPVNRHKAYSHLEGLDTASSTWYILQEIVAYEAQHGTAWKHQSMGNSEAFASAASLRTWMRKPVQFPQQSSKGHYVHRQVTREEFKRTHALALEPDFSWEDDDTDGDRRSKRKKKGSNPLGRAWDQLAGGLTLGGLMLEVGLAGEAPEMPPPPQASADE